MLIKHEKKTILIEKYSINILLFTDMKSTFLEQKNYRK